MRYLSVCAGIEAATQAWHPLGWTPVAFSEIEPFPCAVLAHHYPSVPNWGDMTKFQEWPDANVDVLVGGTPCQSFSVAGLRAGLADPRGNLALTYLAIAERYRPTWLVWENVPGVLSADGGRAFGAIIGGMVELGYCPAWRVLDAQYVRTRRFPHAVPQRRRRVFVVAHLGDWRRAAAVLFDAESLCGNPPPRREAGQGVAGSIAACSFVGGAGGRPEGAAAGHFLPAVANPLTARMHKGINTTLDEGQTPVLAFDTTQLTSPANYSNPQPGDACHPLAAGAHAPCIALQDVTPREKAQNGKGYNNSDPGMEARMHILQPVTYGITDDETVMENCLPTMATPSASGGGHPPAVATAMQVRRLTPVECERLQGFPDNYTAIPWRNKPASECPDGPRYKALGNSIAVNCLEWIGERMQAVSE